MYFLCKYKNYTQQKCISSFLAKFVKLSQMRLNATLYLPFGSYAIPCPLYRKPL